jgi:DNA-binding NarL/FixJ family response regulator
MKLSSMLQTSSVAAVVGTLLLGVAVAGAKTPRVTCKQIQDALQSGKTAAEVAKELKVSEARVKRCSSTTSSTGASSHPASHK